MPRGEARKRGWPVLGLLLVAGCGSRSSLELFATVANDGPGGTPSGGGGAVGTGGAIGTGAAIGSGGTPPSGCPGGTIDDDRNEATPCIPCPPGMFSDADGFACFPWTECSWEFPEVAPPSSSSDRVCGASQPARQFGTDGADEAFDVVVDDSGNVYVVGSTTGALDGPGSTSYDAFVRKYSAQGGLLWGYQGDSGGFERAVRVARDGLDRLHVMVLRDTTTAFWLFDADGTLLAEESLDGNYVDMAVDKQGTRYFTRPVYYSDDTSDVELTRIRPDGSIDWILVTDGGTFDTPGALAALPNGVIVAGATNGGLFAPGSGQLEGFVARVSTFGTQVWGVHFLSSAEDISPHGVALDSADNVYVAGVTALDPMSPHEGFIARVSADGELEWVSVQGTAARDVYWAVAVDPFDQVAVAGDTEGAFGGANLGKEDAFVARTFGDGSLGPVLQFGSPLADLAQGIAAAPDGAWFVAGTTDLALDGQVGAGSYDAFVLRVPPF